MNVFKFLNSFRLHNEAAEAEAGGLPSPMVNPRAAAMAQIAKQAHQNVAADLNAFNEDSGEIEQKAPQEEKEDKTPPVEAKPESEDKPAQEEKKDDPPKPRMVSIVVDGQSIEVEESRILEAGKRTLQKESAADKRLQEAARKEQQAQQLLEQAQRVSGQGTHHNTAPSQDAQTAQQATNGVAPEMLDTVLETKLYIRDAQKAREAFLKEFPEIAADPDLMQVAAQREQTRLNTAAALGEGFGDPFEAYRKHGEYIREKFKTAPAPAPTATLADKQERKRTITAVSAVNARAPAPQDKKPLSTSEIIEAQRLARRGRSIIQSKGA